MDALKTKLGVLSVAKYPVFTGYDIINIDHIFVMVKSILCIVSPSPQSHTVNIVIACDGQYICLKRFTGTIKPVNNEKGISLSFRVFCHQ